MTLSGATQNHIPSVGCTKLRCGLRVRWFAQRPWLVPIVALIAAWPVAANADPDIMGAPREARMVWDGPAQDRLLTDVSFRDIVDADIRNRMSRGLPTTIVLTATLHQLGSSHVLATTAQTCRITWHVWEEAYRLEVSKPGEVRAPAWTTTVEGVLRRCAESHKLLTATRSQVMGAGPLILKAKVQVNPVSDDVLQKIKRWVNRPAGTSTAAPGDALFSTFTGLFLQRVGEAERVLVFTTKPAIPTVANDAK